MITSTAKSKKDKTPKGPQFIRFFRPMLDVLKELGGSGNTPEVIDLVLERTGISEEELAEKIASGGSRVRNQVYWARLYLSKAGLMETSQRGVWTLTEKGWQLDNHALDPLAFFRTMDAAMKGSNGKADTDNNLTAGEDEIDSDSVSTTDHRTSLLQLLQSLPPEGFERLCQRLLREAGFQQVFVTGKSGDGGLDGHGILQVNPLVTFRVLFQCKRYQGSISASVVRDFRGAMMGRSDKGIIITTGTFSPDSRKEAIRDGAPPIELVDGEKLVQMFEQLELGLVPKKVYVIDQPFFDEFR